MATIKIDGQDYETEALPPAARQQLEMIQFAEAEINRVQAHIAVLKTAQMAYGRAFREAVQKAASEAAQAAPGASLNVSGETIKFG